MQSCSTFLKLLLLKAATNLLADWQENTTLIGIGFVLLKTINGLNIFFFCHAVLFR